MVRLEGEDTPFLARESFRHKKTFATSKYSKHIKSRFITAPKRTSPFTNLEKVEPTLLSIDPYDTQHKELELLQKQIGCSLCFLLWSFLCL